MLRLKSALCVLLAVCLVALCAGCGTENGNETAPGESAPPEMRSGDMPQGEPPEKPDGKIPQGEPPEKPDGEMPKGEPPEKPGGNMPQGEPPEKPDGAGFGGEAEFTQGESANTVTTDGTLTGEKYSSDGDDENALRVTGAAVTLKSVSVDKAGGESSNTEAGDFYGVNAALLATDGAQVTISGSSISSSAKNGNGIFAYGEGTQVNIASTVINTTGDNSGGIQTTGGATTTAESLTVETEGSSSAAIRTDRGGGTVTVTGGSYRTLGLNSPAVYSTADITVSKASLKSESSEALVIEGKNSLTLKECTVTGAMSKTEGSSSAENVHNVMLYQSMSGDAEEGTARFAMTGGTLTGKSGDMFYITNTRAVIKLSEVTIKNLDESGYLLRVSGNSGERGWGKAGQNGAQAELTATKQRLEGDILVDSISTLTLNLKDESEFTGSISILKNAEGTAAEDNAVITVGEGCTWTLTGNCTVSRLENHGLINFNGYSITLADGSVLQ